MAHLWDAVYSKVANNCLSSLPIKEQEECRQVVRDHLCDRPDSRPTVDSYPNSPGTRECSISGWFFRYGIENSNTIWVYSIHYSPDNPKSPLYGLFPDGPPPPPRIR